MWSDRKKWSDKFLPLIKSIVGQNLITEPPIKEDQRRNTDLSTLNLQPIRISCRVRSYRYAKYYDEFTVRDTLSSNHKTELEKVMEGWGDYLFYGISNEKEDGFVAWYLCDLNVFRRYIYNELLKNRKLPGTTRRSSDGNTFRIFKYKDLPKEFIINSYVEDDLIG